MNRLLPMRTDRLILLSSLALLAVAWLGLFAAPVPTILSPFPALTVIPALLLSNSQLSRSAVLGPALFFLAWNPGLFKGDGEIPKRTYVLLAATTALTAAWFVANWNWGLYYQGARFVYSVLALNVVWLVGLWTMLYFIRKREPSFTMSLVLHCFLFAWLAWYAFPYLGELP